LLHRRFEFRPMEQYYSELKTAAKAIGRWEVLRPKVIDWLEKKQNYTVLIQCYLHDQEWDAAWEVLEKQKKSKQNMWAMWGFQPLDFEVAKRSQKARPEKAIAIFTKYIRSEIGLRERKHYASAAELLATVRDLYKEIGDKESGDKLIASIRAEFPQLPALKEELKKAGL
jgi:pentatricopeptide repeat protein